MLDSFFASMLAADPIGSILDWARVESASERWLVVFGLLGQSVFFARWIVQWIATERRGVSHMPELFWWSSLMGAMMVLIYFVLRRDIVGILGQSVGWTVYARNLVLIYRAKRLAQVDET